MLNLKNTLDGYLKNVEVIGNTIQDTNNLDNIRSVGDKVDGQELYKIDVVSCGKNLFDSSIYGEPTVNNVSNSVSYDELTNTYTLTYSTGYACIIFDLTKYLPSFEGKTIIPSCTTTNTNPSAKTAFYLEGVDVNDKTHYFNSSNGYNIPKGVLKTLRFKLLGNNLGTKLSGVCTFTDIQLEEGTVATPYETYKENKLEILSPVQLEKVGDVADRIICKDGVWGIEKNISTVIYDGSENWYKAQHKPTTAIPEYRLDRGITNYYLKNQNKLCSANAISNKYNLLGSQEHVWTSTVEGFAVGSYNYYGTVYISSTYTTLTEFKENLGNLTIKYQLAEPQFIPLPQDQQVKLRTFAGQTNIFFNTEIAGQVKAQVPKSLGAVVNTHTEQIEMLHNALKSVLAGDMYSLATILYPEDFIHNDNTEQDIMVIPE